VLTYTGVAALHLTSMHNNPAFLATCGMAVGWVMVGGGMAVRAYQRQLPVSSAGSSTSAGSWAKP
jgi:hypothetical protein